MAGNAPRPSTVTDHEARNNRNGFGAVEAESGDAQELYNNGDRTSSTTEPVPASTRDVHARDTAASNGKRKLDRTSPESLPAAKRLHTTGKEGCEKRPEPEDDYKYLKQSFMQKECRSRSLPDDGSIQDLRYRLRQYDAARAHIYTSQGSVKEAYTSSRAEPLDRYTQMSQKEIRKECMARSIPSSLAKRELRHRVRLYDAARALGLTPEESLEAQKATLQQCNVSPRGSMEENAFDATPEEAIEGHTRDNTREFVDGQGSTFRNSPEDDASRSKTFQAFSDNAITSSSATSPEPTQDRGISNRAPGPARMHDYAAMGQTELRSLCRSRSLKQHGLSGPQLRMALTTYDNKLAQTNNAEVEGDAEHTTAEPGDVPTPSPPPVAFIDLDSSSQNGETAEQRTRSVVTNAAVAPQKPVSGYLLTINQDQRTPGSSDPQIENRQVKSKEQASAERSSEKGAYVSPQSPRLVLKPPKRFGNESSPKSTPYSKRPMSLHQPLVSILNLTIKDARSAASKRAHQETLGKSKSQSEHAIKTSEKEGFNTRYATEAPFWICCCSTPGYEVRQKQLAKFSGNCLYHVSQLAQRGTFTMKEYQEYQTTQQALDRVATCLCQKPAVDHPEHQITMTQGGFILTQIWREQLIRRQSLTVIRHDLAAYRRKGILEVMHNVLEDFMIELSNQQQRRPLVLWARIEAMAWFISILPTSNEWHYFQDWRRPCRYIMLFGIALLTTIDALLRQNVFQDNEPKVPNIGLVLALFIQSTWNSPSSTMSSFYSKDPYNSPFNNDICVNNENGWAAEVVSLADQHGIRIQGVKSIGSIVDRWRLRKKVFESIPDWARKEQYDVLHNGKTMTPSQATSASVAAEVGEPREMEPRETVRASLKS